MINPGPPPAARHRRQRIPADEVRAKMLTAARDLVFASGVTVSVEELSLEDVIRRAGVPRSSVYRIWPCKGDFVDDLLCHLAGQAGRLVTGRPRIYRDPRHLRRA